MAALGVWLRTWLDKLEAANVLDSVLLLYA